MILVCEKLLNWECRKKPLTLRNMKIPVLAVFLCLILSGCQKPKSEIHYIGLYTSVITSLSCDNLKKATHKSNLILSEKENNELLTLFSHLTPTANDINIDARLYGFVWDEKNKRSDFCMNLGLIELNGKKYFVNDELRKYVLKLTKEKEVSDN